MVLEQLGGKIMKALQTMTRATIIDEEVIKQLVSSIALALLQADVDVRLVKELQTNIVNTLNVDEMPPGVNKRRLIHSTVVQELAKLLSSEKKHFEPKKGKTNVVMFVGLQGSGKTTTVTKYGYYYKKRGFKVALICADTFRAGALDQLKQNALKAKIAFYGSYTESDPVVVAQQGVEQFKKEKFDLIIVDTSGRHKQEEALFEEMKEVRNVTNPDDIVLVIDASIGQAARDQAAAFKAAVPVGSVIVTKLDGHAKGGGALSAVAATKAPIIFIGTGEHMEHIEPFDTKSFVSRLLGMGDIEGLMSVFEEKKIVKSQEDMMKRIVDSGAFSFRDMKEQFHTLLELGPLSQIMDKIPGFSAAMGGKMNEEQSVARIKRFITIMDSFTYEELESDGKCFNTQPNRLMRIARGSGASIRQVQDVIDTHKPFKKVAAKLKAMKKQGIDLEGKMGGRGGMKMPDIRQLASAMGPGMMQKMGGMGKLQQMLKSFGGGGGMMPGMGFE